MALAASRTAFLRGQRAQAAHRAANWSAHRRDRATTWSAHRIGDHLLCRVFCCSRRRLRRFSLRAAISLAAASLSALVSSAQFAMRPMEPSLPREIGPSPSRGTACGCTRAMRSKRTKRIAKMVLGPDRRVGTAVDAREGAQSSPDLRCVLGRRSDAISRRREDTCQFELLSASCDSRNVWYDEVCIGMIDGTMSTHGDCYPRVRPRPMNV